MLKELERIGLQRNEARLYLSLIEHGPCMAGELSKQAQINRTTTYDILDRLIAEGLASYHLESQRKIFHATPPSTLLDIVRQKQQAAERIIPQLEQLQDKEEEYTEIFRGRKGINTILQQVLTCDSYEALGSSGQFMERMRHDFVSFQNEKKRRGITSRVLQNISSKDDTEFKQVAHASIRYLDSEHIPPTTTILYGDNTAIITWGAQPSATVIHSKPVTASFRDYFETLWKNAKR